MSQIKSGTSVLLIAMCSVVSVAGCGEAGTNSGGKSGTNYTKLSIAGSTAGGSQRCGSSELSVGQQAEPIISVTNTSGHAWKSTWVWISGTGDNLKLEPGHGFGETSVPSIAMDNRPADETYASASQYNLGPLPAGEVGDIHIYLTAENGGSPKLLFAVWGNSEAKPTPSIPDSPGGFTCRYTIN
jgi:hypothetical protein